MSFPAFGSALGRIRNSVSAAARLSGAQARLGVVWLRERSPDPRRTPMRTLRILWLPPASDYSAVWLGTGSLLGLGVGRGSTTTAKGRARNGTPPATFSSSILFKVFIIFLRFRSSPNELIRSQNRLRGGGNGVSQPSLGLRFRIGFVRSDPQNNSALANPTSRAFTKAGQLWTRRERGLTSEKISLRP